MAAQFDQARVVLQPTQQEAPAQTDVFEQGARVAGQLGGMAQQDASQQAAKSQNLYQRAVSTVSAAFDQAISSYNELAVENAKKEAPAAVTRDANGMVVAPTTFWPSGFHSMAYAKAYKASYEATYVQSAVADHENYSALQKAKFSADPTGYANAMKERRQLAMTGLAPDMAPFIDIRFQQIEGQGTTQIGVNLQAQKNEVMKKNAELEIDAIIDTASRTPTIMASVPSNTQGLQTIEERVINDGVLGKRWAGVAAQMTQAGYSPEFIERTRKEMGFRVAMASEGRKIRDQVMVDQDRGVVAGDTVAAQQTGIYAFAAQFPGREGAIIQHLNAQLSAAVSQSGRIAAGIQLGLEKKLDADAKATRLAAAVAEDPATPEDEKKAIRDDLRLKTIGALTNPNIPDNIALRYAQNAQQAGALSNQAYGQVVSQRLVNLRELSTNPESTPQQRESADQQLREIRNAPDLQSSYTAEQQSYINQTISANAVRRIGGQLTGAFIEAQQGNLKLADAAELVRKGVANGSIGNHQGAVWPMETATRFLATAAAADVSKTTSENLLGSGARARQQNRPPTADEVAEIEKSRPFKPSGPPGTTPDITNPQHQAEALAYIDKWQVTPKWVKQSFDAMPRGEDPAAFAPYRSMFEGLINTAAGLGIKERQDQINWALKQTGDKGYFILDAMDRGLEAAAASVKDDGTPSTTAQTGGPAKQSDQGIASKIDGVVAKLSEVHTQSAAMAKLKQFKDPFSSTDDEKRAAMFFGDYTQKRAADEPVLQTPTSVTIADDVRAQIAADAAGLKATNGKIVARLKLEGGDIDQHFIARAMDGLKDKTERLPDPSNPANAIVQYKSFNSTLRDTLKVPSLSKDAERGIALATLAIRDQGPNQIWQPYDRQSVMFTPVRNPGDEMIWRVTARGNNGQIIHLTDMKQDDKALSGHTSQLMRTAAVGADQWASIFGGSVDPATGKPNVESSSFFGQLFAQAITNPVSTMAYRNKIESQAISQNKMLGWEDSFVDLLRGISDIYHSTMGTAPKPVTEAETQKLYEEVRKADDASAGQIKRYGLLHYLFRDTPDDTLLPEIGKPAGPRIGTGPRRYVAGTAPPDQRRNIFPGGNMQPYEPYDYSKPNPGMPPRLEGWDISGNQ